MDTGIKARQVERRSQKTPDIEMHHHKVILAHKFYFLYFWDEF